MQKIFLILIVTTILVTSCGGPKRERGSVYMPDMAYGRAYDTYANMDPDKFTAVDSIAGSKIFYNKRPIVGTVKRGQMGVYNGTNDSIGIVNSASYQNPLAIADMSKTDMEESERLYKIYCAICHSEKLDGQGPIVASGKFSSAAANLMDAKFSKAMYPDGRIFHTITFGKNQMGSYASQLNNKQRWMIVNYIRSKQLPTTAVAATNTAATVVKVETKTVETKPTTDTGKLMAKPKMK